jgi:uncharacterized protein (UPF0548 family)
MEDDYSSAEAAGYYLKGIRKKIGYGTSDFVKASNILFSFNMTNTLDWIQIISLPGILKKGDPICTNSRFYGSPLWTLNPCKVVSVKKDFITHQSHVLYATVDGHLISGEEIFRVFITPNVMLNYYFVLYCSFIIFFCSRKMLFSKSSLCQKDLDCLVSFAFHWYDLYKTNFYKRTWNLCTNWWAIESKWTTNRLFILLDDDAESHISKRFTVNLPKAFLPPYPFLYALLP